MCARHHACTNVASYGKPVAVLLYRQNMQAQLVLARWTLGVQSASAGDGPQRAGHAACSWLQGSGAQFGNALQRAPAATHVMPK
jgi:hypothetical protein